MYVTGTTLRSPAASVIRSQAASTCSASAIPAIGQDASIDGRRTV